MPVVHSARAAAMLFGHSFLPQGRCLAGYILNRMNELVLTQDLRWQSDRFYMSGSNALIWFLFGQSC